MVKQNFRIEEIKGGNNYPVTRGRVFRPERIDDLASLVNRSSEPILARGGGTAYGDSSINDKGVNIDTKRLDKMLHFDAEQGILHCQGGVLLQDISKVFIPRGWFLSVTPGTQYATVGGCVATDAHGKNWKAGSFSSYVRGFNLMLRDGRIVYCDDHKSTDLFCATVGGMGMTGVILDVFLQLKRIRSSRMEVESIPCRDLEECFDVQAESMESYEYIFCWLDSQKDGRNMGRGVLQRANHCPNSDLIYKEKKKVPIPFYLPNATVNAYSVRAFNQCYYWSVRKKTRRMVYLMDFFYPLDCIAKWYRIYGRRGFVEYQAVIPFEGAQATIHELLRLITRSRLGSTVAAIKPLLNSRGTLSFPMDGVTLAVDFMIQGRLWKFLDTLDKIVVASKGRVYLAKDARLPSDKFRKMYSKSLDEWLDIRARYNADNGLSSMMFSRLHNV